MSSTEALMETVQLVEWRADNWFHSSYSMTDSFSSLLASNKTPTPLSLSLHTSSYLLCPSATDALLFSTFTNKQALWSWFNGVWKYHGNLSVTWYTPKNHGIDTIISWGNLKLNFLTLKKKAGWNKSILGSNSHY